MFAEILLSSFPAFSRYDLSIVKIGITSLLTLSSLSVSFLKLSIFSLSSFSFFSVSSSFSSDSINLFVFSAKLISSESFCDFVFKRFSFAVILFLSFSQSPSKFISAFINSSVLVESYKIQSSSLSLTTPFISRSILLFTVS